MINQITFTLEYFGKLVYDSDSEGSLNNSAWKQITNKCMDQPCGNIYMPVIINNLYLRRMMK